jgi:hypothetical protein
MPALDMCGWVGMRRIPIPCGDHLPRGADLARVEVGIGRVGGVGVGGVGVGVGVGVGIGGVGIGGVGVGAVFTTLHNGAPIHGWSGWWLEEQHPPSKVPFTKSLKDGTVISLSVTVFVKVYGWSGPTHSPGRAPIFLWLYW